VQTCALPISEVNDSELALEMVRLVLESDPDGSVPGRQPVPTPPVKIVAGGDGAGAAVVTEDGLEPLDESKAELVTEGRNVPPWMKQKMLARDGHCCLNCTGRRNLQPHHVQWVSRGGKTVLRNLATLCSRCHGLVHDGFLEVEVAHRGLAAAGTGRPRSRSADPEPLDRDADVTTRRSGCASAAHCATSGAVRFVFFDADGRRLDRRVLCGPKVEVPKPPPRKKITEIDAKFFQEHAHWFCEKHGKLTVKEQYRHHFG